MTAPISEDKPATFVRVSPRVTVALGAVENQRAASNASLVFGDEATLVVDTTVAPTLARAVRLEAERLGGRPVSHVINSHGDPDHVLGNSEFPDATVVAHRTVAELFDDPQKRSAYQERLDRFGEGRVRAPDTTFEKDHEIDLGGLRALITYVGPAHSVGDSLVWLPEERVLIAADTVFNGLFPLLRDDLKNWSAALTMAIELDPLVVVPGHGPVGDIATLRWQRDLLDEIHESVKAQFAAAVPLEVAKESEPPAFVANLPLAQERWPGAVACVYRVLSDESSSA